MIIPIRGGRREASPKGYRSAYALVQAVKWDRDKTTKPALTAFHDQNHMGKVSIETISL